MTTDATRSVVAVRYAWISQIVTRRVRLQALFSFNCFLSTMLALYIGFSIGLPRPYWAMATVYIVSQPLSGAVRSKGVYRIIGTPIGAAAAIGIVSVLNASPELLSLGLASWVGLCLYISLLDRTPRSYVFLLAGYTAAIIGFPSATAPAQVFDIATARVEEIGLGVVCATVVHSLIFPQAVGPVLNQRIAKWIGDSDAWIVDVMGGRTDPGLAADRRRLAADIGEIRVMATHLPFDTSNLRHTGRIFRALQRRMTMLLPAVSAVGDRLNGLRAQGPLEAEMEAAVQEVVAWAGDPAAPQDTTIRLAAKLDRLAPPIDARSTWRDVLKDNLLDRLRLLLGAVQDLRDLRSSLSSVDVRPSIQINPALRVKGRSPLYRDHYLAFLSALAVAVSVLVCCAIWIVTGWPEGAVAALIAAVFCSFFAAQDDPAPAIKTFLTYTVVGVIISGFYEVVILPAVDGFAMLTLVLAPAMLVLGYLAGGARTVAKALPAAVGVANALALSDSFKADFAGFVNANVAQVIGLLVALFVTRLLRSVGADWSAWRILRTAWRHIAEAASASQPQDQTALAAIMVDRVGLLVPRLTLLPKTHRLLDVDVLRDLRIGINTQELQRTRPVLAGSGGAETRLLSGIESHYRRLASGKADKLDLTVPPSVLRDLDTALAEATRQAPQSAEARDGVRVLVALRRNLFPDALPYQAGVAA